MNSPSTPSLLPFLGNPSAHPGSTRAGLTGDAAAIAQWQAEHAGQVPPIPGMPFAGLLGHPTHARGGQPQVAGTPVVDPEQIADLAFPSTFVEGALINSPRGMPVAARDAEAPVMGEAGDTETADTPRLPDQPRVMMADGSPQLPVTSEQVVATISSAQPVGDAPASSNPVANGETQPVAKAVTGAVAQPVSPATTGVVAVAKSTGEPPATTPAPVTPDQPAAKNRAPQAPTVAASDSRPAAPAVVSREALIVDAEHRQINPTAERAGVVLEKPNFTPTVASTGKAVSVGTVQSSESTATVQPSAPAKVSFGDDADAGTTTISVTKTDPTGQARFDTQVDSIKAHVASAGENSRPVSAEVASRAVERLSPEAKGETPPAEARPQTASQAIAGTAQTSPNFAGSTREAATQLNADQAIASRVAETAVAAQPQAVRKTATGEGTAPTRSLEVATGQAVPTESDPVPATDARRAAEIAADLTRDPAVALPITDGGWKKILLNTYKELDKYNLNKVGIKDAETSGIMSSVMSAPTSSIDATAAVAQTSNSYSSIPAEWAEKLTQLAARAERLAPAKLEVRLPVQGADDLRVQVTCRGGNIRCEFHNASSELQSLFMREWPGLSQLFGKESQLRVEQPNFVNYVERHKNGGEAADQQQQQQRRESAAQREEDDILSAFLATRRGSSRPAA